MRTTENRRLRKTSVRQVIWMRFLISQIRSRSWINPVISSQQVVCWRPCGRKAGLCRGGGSLTHRAQRRFWSRRMKGKLILLFHIRLRFNHKRERLLLGEAGRVINISARALIDTENAAGFMTFIKWNGKRRCVYLLYFISWLGLFVIASVIFTFAHSSCASKKQHSKHIEKPLSVCIYVYVYIRSHDNYVTSSCSDVDCRLVLINSIHFILCNMQ